MTFLFYLGIGLVVIALAGVIYFFFFNKGNAPLRRDTVTINSAIFDVEVASTTLERMNGLSYRASLGENQGMFFTFGTGTVQTFWMKDMNFPLDIIWISGDVVAGFAENAAPQPGDPLWKLKIYSSPDDTDRVLEVNAGTVAKDNIKVGDLVKTSI